MEYSESNVLEIGFDIASGLHEGNIENALAGMAKLHGICGSNVTEERAKSVAKIFQRIFYCRYSGNIEHIRSNEYEEYEEE